MAFTYQRVCVFVGCFKSRDQPPSLVVDSISLLISRSTLAVDARQGSQQEYAGDEIHSCGLPAEVLFG